MTPKLTVDADGKVAAKHLYEFLMAKAAEYHGKGDGPERIMHAGRVDALWTVAADVQDYR